jgi:hypothetical protein
MKLSIVRSPAWSEILNLAERYGEIFEIKKGGLLARLTVDYPDFRLL